MPGVGILHLWDATSALGFGVMSLAWAPQAFPFCVLGTPPQDCGPTGISVTVNVGGKAGLGDQ